VWVDYQTKEGDREGPARAEKKAQIFVDLNIFKSRLLDGLLME
jgi:hypothetical protein